MKSLELFKSFYSVGSSEKQIHFHSEFSRESLRLLKFLVSSGLVDSVKFKGKRAYVPIFPLQEVEGFDFISLNELRAIPMVVRNEKKIQTVIFDGKLKEWVGMGWIDLCEPKADDFKKHPIAMI
mgnify:CR=1 FL=1